MAQNIMKLYVNETGNIVNNVNMTCTQNSSDNVLRLYFKADWDFVSVTFTKPDGTSEKHFMTIQYDIDDNIYAEYTLPSSLVSFIISGNTGYLTVALQGSYYDSDGYLHEGNVINSQITVRYSNNADILDMSYNKTDVENIWYSIGVINQQLGIGSGDSYLNKVSITQKLNGKQYGVGNLYLYASDINMADNNNTTIKDYTEFNFNKLNTDLSTLQSQLTNGTYLVGRASNDSQGHNIIDTYVPYTYLNNNYYTRANMNSLLADKLNSSTAYNDFYTKLEVDNKITGLYKIKGSVETVGNLPVAGNTIGDCYNVVENGVNYVWTGTEWDALGGLADLSNYATRTYVDEQFTITNTQHSSDFNNLLTLVNNKYNKSDTYSRTEVANLLNTRLANYYTQTEVNGYINTLTGNIADKAAKTDVYTKTQIDNQVSTIENNLALKANSADVYTKSSMDTVISGINSTLDNKADSSDVYTKAEVDALIPEDINMSNYYTKDQVDDEIDGAITELNLSSYAPISYVDTRVASLVNTAPSTLDTLKELADALGNDADFANTVATQLGNKADKSTTYTKTQVDTAITNASNTINANFANYYNKSETISQINDTLTDYYNKTAVDNKLATNYSNAQTYINNRIAALIGAAPQTLDTLEELASAMANNNSAIETINSAITAKANKSEVYVRSELYTKAEVDALIAAVPQCRFVFRDYTVANEGE